MSNRRPRQALSRARDMIPALDAAANVRRLMVFSTDGDGGAFIRGNLCRCVVDRFDDPHAGTEWRQAWQFKDQQPAPDLA